MSDLISDGNTKVSWVATIANINAPTAAELNGGSDWTTRITPDGLKTDPATADVDTSSLGSTFTTNQPGRRAYTVEVTFKRGTLGTSDDQPYTTLVYNAAGYLVVRRGVAYGTAYATGDKVEVYPVSAGEAQNIAPAANEVSKFMSPLKVTSDPATHATSPDCAGYPGVAGQGRGCGSFTVPVCLDGDAGCGAGGTAGGAGFSGRVGAVVDR
jgi:hypothetical protein